MHRYRKLRQRAPQWDFDPIEEILAFIPARGGSKGVPAKNIAMIGNKPLIAHSIEPALACSTISRVVVSTESPEVAAIATRHGAEVPFLRPLELADDKAKLDDAFFYTLDQLYRQEGYEPQAVLIILPCYPFKSAALFEATIAMMKRYGATSITPIVPRGYDHHRCFFIDHGKVRIPRLADDRIHDEPGFQIPCNFTLTQVFPWRLIHGRAANADEYYRLFKTIWRERYAQQKIWGRQYIRVDELTQFEIDAPEDLELARFIFDRQGEA